LFDNYYVQPGEMLIRGKTDSLPRRLERIRTVIEDAEFATPQEEQDLLKQAAAWRERVNAAYLALSREPDGGRKVGAIWAEDQYLLFLLDPDEETTPRNVKKN